MDENTLNDSEQFDVDEFPAADDTPGDIDDDFSKSVEGTETEDNEDAEDEEDEPTVVTVSRPVLDSMDSFVWKHDKTLIIKELNEKLMDGTIDRLLGCTVEKKLINSSHVEVVAADYWQLNSSDLLADLTCHITVGELTFALYLTLWYNTEEEFTSELQEIGLADDLPQRTFTKLDEYLVPIMNNDDIEDAADMMWLKYDKDAFIHPEAKNPWNLAARMNLDCKQLRLFEEKKVQSSLFLEPGTVRVQKYNPDSPAGHTPSFEKVEIPANTIVLNTSLPTYDERMLDIYHECFHSENHAMFFRLQKMIQTDVTRMKRRQIKCRKDRLPTDVVSLLEYQATRGAYALMLPRSVVKKDVTNKVMEIQHEARETYAYMNSGIAYEEVLRYLSVYYHVPAWRVKRRLLQYGHLAVKGAHNYVDGNFIAPFAFSIGPETRLKDTYVIDRRNAHLLYAKEKKFRTLMQSGDYVFVDGHICANSPQFIKVEEGEAQLTLWARAHVDECCLRFTLKYDNENGSSSYKFGRLNSVEAYNRHYRGFLDKKGVLSDNEYREVKDALVEKVLPLSFSEMLVVLMKYGNSRSERFTNESLAEAAHLSARTITHLRNEAKGNYKRDQVLAICFAMHLPSWLSTILLDKANIQVPRYGHDGYLGELLDCNFMDTIDDIQKYLKDNHYPPLAVGNGEE